jgi:hypothetical protein
VCAEFNVVFSFACLQALGLKDRKVRFGFCLSELIVCVIKFFFFIFILFCPQPSMDVFDVIPPFFFERSLDEQSFINPNTERVSVTNKIGCRSFQFFNFNF